MNNKTQVFVAPSLLAADPGNFAGQIQEIEKAGADWLHIDVMDGTFVPSITFGDNIVKMASKCSKLFLDVHLMIANPDRHIEAFAQAGSHRIIVHQESCPHLHRVLGGIKNLGISNGVAINPGTPAESILEVLEVSDLVLVMTVNPGWGGQKFISSCLSKIEFVRNEASKRGLNIHVEVDGGINAETARLCTQAGANALVAGSYVFGHADKKSAISSLKV